MKLAVILILLLAGAPTGAQSIFDSDSTGGSTSYEQWRRDHNESLRRQEARELEEQNRRLRALEQRRQRERDYYNNPRRPIHPKGKDCGPFRQIC